MIQICNASDLDDIDENLTGGSDNESLDKKPDENLNYDSKELSEDDDKIDDDSSEELITYEDVNKIKSSKTIGTIEFFKSVSDAFKCMRTSTFERMVGRLKDAQIKLLARLAKKEICNSIMYIYYGSKDGRRSMHCIRRFLHFWTKAVAEQMSQQNEEETTQCELNNKNVDIFEAVKDILKNGGFLNEDLTTYEIPAYIVDDCETKAKERRGSLKMRIGLYIGTSILLGLAPISIPCAIVFGGIKIAARHNENVKLHKNVDRVLGNK